MEVYTSGSDSDSGDIHSLDLSYSKLTSEQAEDKILTLYQDEKLYWNIEFLHLNNNQMHHAPIAITKFSASLTTLDLSNNNLKKINWEILYLCPLTTLIVKNNNLSNESLPKSFCSKSGQLRELNLSGNSLKHFPEQALELKMLKYLYLGGNQIQTIHKDIWRLTSLQLLSLGGNQITEIPETIGNLNNLQALIMCDNQIERLPSSIARLTDLKSLLLHKNNLKHLPRELISLRNLSELSLRENPLVDRFVQELSLIPTSLKELSARSVKSNFIPFGPEDLPRTVIDYLSSANCCVNPECKGVFFDNRVENVKFVDFCGKYRVPFLQYLCSSKCIETANPSTSHQNYNQNAAGSSAMMRKVLLG